ncbi:MAG: hypothetical protein A2092_06590 [Rhodobacteraceae bacterium GWE1_64_9]|nr:MAG: hypothetical protein A2092_06590 [Rhodobacteraceae bacterium GWE1_64_9]OHC48268.1 MAG: hypothetical protein A2X69_16140 [Rhodobacteraceae bacterium GWF1_65_7]HBD20504.1 hypothetical protein [Arenimonas sp.]HBU13723.1 hypothetical protein [Gemmobacter sp.]
MQINISFDRPEDGPNSGPISVGWFLTSDKGAVLYDPPERVSFRQTNRSHAKSAARCPGVIQLESRYFMVKCPFDLHIGFGRDDKGKAHLVNRAGAGSTIRSNKLGEVLTLVNEAEWRYPDRPTVQLSLPYCFIADETVFLTQLSPFLHYRREALPGTIFGGRFPINVWPRPLMWAFEWHEPERDIILKRGEPLFYCQFEGTAPDRPVQLIEAARTPELQTYLEQIGGVVNYVNHTFGLFKAAEALRPARLLQKKDD